MAFSKAKRGVDGCQHRMRARGPRSKEKGTFVPLA